MTDIDLSIRSDNNNDTKIMGKEKGPEDVTDTEHGIDPE